MINQTKEIFFILGKKNIIRAYRQDKKSPLFASPYEFTVQKFKQIDDALRVIKSVVGNEAFEEINIDEYLLFHAYLNGALERIFNSDL